MMCAILLAQKKNVELNDFSLALKQMQHRGPDAFGIARGNKNLFLGHNRLSILDLDPRSNQPFESNNKRYKIIFNGEIYNYREVAKQLNLDLRTTSDTEVIVEGYSLIGPKILRMLNGMFAFVIVDSTTNQIFAARDRLGVKPLYMWKKSDEIILASEVNAILQLTNDTKIDAVSLRQIKKLRTTFNGRTLYESIQMFPPGTYYLDGKFEQYWSLPDTDMTATPPADEELSHLISDAVKIRKVADVPLGTLLSGGLDSTIVTAIAEVSDTWTVGFDDENEFYWGRIAARSSGTKQNEIIVNREQFLSEAKKIAAHRREPLNVPNEVLISIMAKEIREKNTVVLCGEGADELFFGYDRIFTWANSSKWDLKQFADLYSYGSSDDMEIIEDAIAPFLDPKNTLKTVAGFFQHAHLHGLLRRLDSSTMFHSIEARAPFTDYRLVERLWGVPFNYRMNDGIIKAPLKRVFQNLIPTEIIQRKKVGFPVSLERMMPTEIEGKTAFDKWVNFNLQNAGINNSGDSV